MVDVYAHGTGLKHTLIEDDAVSPNERGGRGGKIPGPGPQWGPGL